MSFLFTTLPVEGIPQANPEDIQSVYSEFQIEPLPGKILFAFYGYQDYEGDAYVLYQDEEGTLWEVEGSHCSCNGLEEQWSPGEVTVPYLLKRVAEGGNSYTGFGIAIDDIKKVAEYLDKNAKPV